MALFAHNGMCLFKFNSIIRFADCEQKNYLYVWNILRPMWLLKSRYHKPCILLGDMSVAFLTTDPSDVWILVPDRKFSNVVLFLYANINMLGYF